MVLLTVICLLASAAMSSTANSSSRADSFGLFCELISKEIQKNIKHYQGKCEQVNSPLKIKWEKIGCLYIFSPVLLLSSSDELSSWSPALYLLTLSLYSIEYEAHIYIDLQFKRSRRFPITINTSTEVLFISSSSYISSATSDLNLGSRAVRSSKNCLMLPACKTKTV